MKRGVRDLSVVYPVYVWLIGQHLSVHLHLEVPQNRSPVILRKVAGYTMEAETMYIEWHNQVAGIVHRNITTVYPKSTS